MRYTVQIDTAKSLDDIARANLMGVIAQAMPGVVSIHVTESNRKAKKTVNTEKFSKEENAKLLEKRRARVLKKLQAGLSIVETAEKLSMPRSMVYNDKVALKKQGYDI